MSVDHLKKQAKNTQRLLEAFAGASKGTVKLATAQEFVAQSHGYPDWHSALCAQESEGRRGPAFSQSDRDMWMMTYEERANRDDVIVSSEVRLIDGAADALGLFWHTQADFDRRQEYPGTPDRFTLVLAECDEPNALADQALQLDYAAIHRSIRMRLYPVSPVVAMLNGPYSVPNTEISSILAKRSGPDDMATIFAAAKVPYDLMLEELIAYHDQHPAKGLFHSLEEHLREFSRQMAETQGPRDGIWQCRVWRLGRWRFQLQYLTAADDFYFDVFDEGGGHDSFIHLAHESAFKRRRAGWTAGPFKGNEASVSLVGVTDSDMDTLRSIAVDCGIGFVVDGMTEIPPSAQGVAEGHQKFLRWLAEKHPEALVGGKHGDR